MKRETEPILSKVEGSNKRRAHVAIRHKAVGPKPSKEKINTFKESSKKFMEAELNSVKDDNGNAAKFNLDGTHRGYIDPASVVADTAFVASTARILGGAKILDNASVENYATVYGATLEGNAMVRDYGFAGPGAHLKDRSWVIESGTAIDVVMSDETEVSGNAVVNGEGKPSELHENVVVAGNAKVLGHNVLKGSLQVRGQYEMIDGGEKTGNELYVQ